MTEFIIGLLIGIVIVIGAARRYRSRDGKTADVVRWIIGATKE